MALAVGRMNLVNGNSCYVSGCRLGSQHCFRLS